MINESANQKIFSHGIQIDKPVLEWNDCAIASTVVVYAGNPVRLDATTGPSTLVAVTTDVKVLGLAKSNQNTYVNEVGGDLGGIYGSGRMSVVMKGIVTLRHNYFQNAVTGAVTQVKTFDDTQSYTKGAAVYPTSAAILATSGVGSTYSKVGNVLDYNSTNKVLQILVDC